MRTSLAAIGLLLVLPGCTTPPEPPPAWEAANPIVPLPTPPLGLTTSLSDLEVPPTAERVRLGRWLFFDRRLSADGTVACASCHHPENGFSELTAVSTGIGGRQGRRKAQSLVNLAWTVYPHFFWDGRAASLEEQATRLIQGPTEMGMSLGPMQWTLNELSGYEPYFLEAFGSTDITIERVAQALADYERTRMSGNSPWDRWRDGDEGAVDDRVKAGHELFFGKAGCNRCHFGQSFTDSAFHNLGVGWDPEAGEFADPGRFEVSGAERDRGAFKTPTLREVLRHAPYMHDGSIETLREVVELYDRGGDPNPRLDPRLEPLGLDEDEIIALVAFLQALQGEGFQDEAPSAFPL